MKSVKLYSVAVPIILMLSVIYGVSVAERAEDNNGDAYVERVEKDAKNVKEFWLSGESANHDNYND